MDNGTQKPRIFVGASSEAEEIDREVRRIIENLGAQAIGWRDIPKSGDNMVDVLVGLPSSVDGALLIVTPDDITHSRSMDRMAPRDNVIFELGIFISRLGKHRTGIIHVVSENQSKAALPTDLNGLTTTKYSPDKPENNKHRLRVWLNEVNTHINDTNPHFDELIELGEKFGTLPNFWQDLIQDYSIKPFKREIKLAMNGEIYLSPGEYYHAIYSEIDNTAPESEVLAVATLSSIIWKGDPEQQDYLEKNLKAAERGTNIRRLFILPDEQWEQIGPVLKKQIDKGIKIHRASLYFLAEFSRIEDVVVFKDTDPKKSRAYVAESGINPNRIRRGRLILNEDIVTGLINTFEKAWTISPEINSRNIPRITTVKKSLKPPCMTLKEYRLEKPVVTCKEAAQAKGIPLENELKTLLVKTSNGFVAIELPGDAKASLIKIKDFLEVKNVHLADIETLKELELEPGTVSAVCPPIWDMAHIISRRLLSLDEVSTNSGDKRGFYRFSPFLLLEAKKVMIGDFEENYK